MESSWLIQEGMGEKLGLGIQFSAAFFFGLGVGFWYCWQLAIVLVVVIPLLVITIGVLIKGLTRASSQSAVAYSKAGSIAQEVLGAIRTVASLGAEQREMARYEAQARRLEKCRTLTTKIPTRFFLQMRKNTS